MKSAKYIISWLCLTDCVLICKLHWLAPHSVPTYAAANATVSFRTALKSTVAVAKSELRATIPIPTLPTLTAALSTPMHIPATPARDSSRRAFPCISIRVPVLWTRLTEVWRIHSSLSRRWMHLDLLSLPLPDWTDLAFQCVQHWVLRDGQLSYLQ